MKYWITFSFLFLTPFARAEIKPDYFSLPKVVAIEERKYDKRFELAFGLGYFPSNAYNRYFSGSLSGTYSLLRKNSLILIQGSIVTSFKNSKNSFL